MHINYYAIILSRHSIEGHCYVLICWLHHCYTNSWYTVRSICSGTSAHVLWMSYKTLWSPVNVVSKNIPFHSAVNNVSPPYSPLRSRPESPNNLTPQNQENTLINYGSVHS